MNHRIVSEMLDMLIKEYVWEIMRRDMSGNIYSPEYAASDNISEVLEKLVILHIRTWYLEDAIQNARSDIEVADLKRKIDQCFKVKRPKLVAALNAILDDAVLNQKPLREDSIKLYKGIQE